MSISVWFVQSIEWCEHLCQLGRETHSGGGDRGEVQRSAPSTVAVVKQDFVGALKYISQLK
jgi:hypothetical protein